MQQPLVSIICTCYNHTDYVVETLNSAYNQTYSNIQIIIVDNCSTDNSVQIINNWLTDKKDIIFIPNQVNLGITKSFNLASQYATGSFLLDLACDDVLLPNTVQQQVSAFLQCDLSQTAMVFGNAELIDKNSSLLGYYFAVDQTKKSIDKIPTKDLYTYILHGEKNGICSVSALINKKIFDQLQGYDENLFFEDLDFWIRAARKHQIVYVDEIWVQKRVLKSSLSFMFSKNKKHTTLLYDTLYKIFIKVYSLNQTKEEDKAIAKRIQTAALNNFKMGRFLFALKLLCLKNKFERREIFN